MWRARVSRVVSVCRWLVGVDVVDLGDVLGEVAVGGDGDLVAVVDAAVGVGGWLRGPSRGDLVP
jgi:hypothetical protein